MLNFDHAITKLKGNIKQQMCGINGFITYNSSGNVVAKLHTMNDAIIHRGPDEEGIYTEETPDFSLGIGMRRLSIIDLSSGNQPFFSDDRNLVLVFNGEIYNYQSLKLDLEKLGVVFKTSSDTEVILKMYEQYGTDSFGKLDGMFAFCIYDRIKQKIILARDFFGEKPLYYIQNNDQFIWSSELKSLVPMLKSKPTISTMGMELFFRLTYIPAPFTIYDEVQKLEANHFLEIDLQTKSYQVFPISHNNSEEITEIITLDQAKKKTRKLLTESVLSRSIADVPLGTFLSGGVDSSIVSLLLAKNSDQKIETFSVGFDEKSYNETEKSRTVAKIIGSNHHEFILKPQEIKDKMKEILLNFDEPFADSSALPTYFVAEKTRKFVKVALTGDGGDEMYGGYNKYYIGKLNKRITSVFPKAVFSYFQQFSTKILESSSDKRGIQFQFLKAIKAIDYQDDFYFNIISLGFSGKEIPQLFSTQKVEKDIFDFYKKQTSYSAKTLTEFRNIDKLVSLEGDMLTKVDRTSMLASLECRAPFLNKKIWDFNASLPEHFLLRGWNKKHLLKESFKSDFPPNFLEQSKKGFGVPIGNWLRQHLRDELLSYNDRKFLENQQLFSVDYVQNLVQNHLNGKSDQTFKVWTYFCFQKWYVNTYQKL